MKLVLGYVLAFLSMTGLAAVVFFGIFLFILGAIIFITWSIPFTLIKWWVVLRLCTIIGIVFGLWFICTKEGAESAKEFADYL